MLRGIIERIRRRSFGVGKGASISEEEEEEEGAGKKHYSGLFMKVAMEILMSRREVGVSRNFSAVELRRADQSPRHAENKSSPYQDSPLLSSISVRDNAPANFSLSPSDLPTTIFVHQRSPRAASAPTMVIVHRIATLFLLRPASSV